jgi:hypothetical protein
MGSLRRRKEEVMGAMQPLISDDERRFFDSELFNNMENLNPFSKQLKGENRWD